MKTMRVQSRPSYLLRIMMSILTSLPTYPSYLSLDCHTRQVDHIGEDASDPKSCMRALRMHGHYDTEKNTVQHSPVSLSLLMSDVIPDRIKEVQNNYFANVKQNTALQQNE